MSRLTSLLPLAALFLVLGGAGYIGYQLYLWSTEISDRGKKHMEKKHMSFTKDGGLKVGVKQRSEEAYEDRTQAALVNMWTTSSEARKAGAAQASSRPSNSRAASSQTAKSGIGAAPSPAAQAPPTQRTESSKSNSSVPGGW